MTGIRSFGRNFTLVLLLLMITSGAAYALSLAGINSLLHEINLTLQEANGKAPIRRMLIANQKANGELKRIDLAASIRVNEINKLIPDIVKRVNGSDDFKKQKFSILSGSIKPGDQLLTAQFEVTKEFNGLTVSLRATADAAVTASEDLAVFWLYFRKIEATKILVTDERLDVGVITPIINSGVGQLIGLLNVVFDREINKKRTFAAQLKFPPLYAGSLKKSDTKNVQFQEREVNIFATITQSAALVTPAGVLLLASAENKKPNRDAASVPKIDDPTPMSDEEVEKALAAYKKSFVERYKAAFGADAPDHSKTSFLLIGRSYAARTLNDALKPPAICAKGQISGKQPPFESKITLPAFGKRKCDDIVFDCKYKDICDGNQCRQTVTKEVDSTCKTGEKFVDAIDPLGALIRKKVDVMSPCKIAQVFQEEIASPVCNGFRAARSVRPEICSQASNLEKAKCDVVKNGEVAFCQAEEEWRRYAAANPVAVVDGDVTPNVALEACVANPNLDEQFNVFKATLSGKAQGPLSVHLAFKNKTPAGVGLCKVNWAEDFKFDASTVISALALSFDVSAESDGDDLNLKFSAGDQDLKVDFKPAPLDVLFAKHPQLLVNCTPVAGLAAAYVAYDTIVNEQAKNWSPLLTGKDYKLTVKDASFKIKVPKLVVKGVDDATLFELKPAWLSKALSFRK